jgi:tRNA-specific 2-thiouridylase
MKKVVVGMSGGVDSSLTAALLAEQGYDVLGVHMQNWHDKRFIRGCSTWPEDRKDALRVARQIGIPFQVVNFAKEYKQRVIEYFFATYQAGRTPNPDILCNREIKFGLLLGWARAHGYDGVATGHYAQAVHGPAASKLLRGVDRTKDQSYFLSQLSQQQLRAALFPLGAMRKTAVRKEAARRNLPVSDKPDSQGLCFVGEINLSAFLKERIPAQPGEVVTRDGEVVGEHEGAAYYTIGQRRGVGVSKAVPMYVVDTDPVKNTVTVGYDRDLYQRVLKTEAPHWLSDSPPDERKRYLVSIRYRMEPQPAKVAVQGTGLTITFDEEQRGPTPGQFAAVYDGEELLGSAVIS